LELEIILHNLSIFIYNNMAKTFLITLTPTDSPGPFNIYYNTISDATLIPASPSSSIKSSLLLGIYVIVADDVNNIYLENLANGCGNFEEVNISTPTPTPTVTLSGPTLTPTPTVTPSGPTPTPTPTVIPSGPTPTPTVTPSGPTPTPTVTPSGPTPTNTPTTTEPPPPPTTTPTTTTTYLANWYQLGNCGSDITEYSAEYQFGTFAINDRVTSPGGNTWVILGYIFGNPAGLDLIITPTGQQFCP